MNIKTKLLILTLATLYGCTSLHDVDVSWCDPQVPQAENINLSADTLFYFDKSSASDLLPKGKATLDELAKKIVNNYASVSQIDLIGHTDRLGSEPYNYTLGLNRAKTVMQYLQNQGINISMSASSAGETNPVTHNCEGARATQKLKACLQPDRRVTIKILGIKNL